MDELPMSNLSQKTVKGICSLLLRQGLTQVIGALGGIVLARILSPAEFGLYGICTFLFFLLMGFGDLGFGAALVRQEETPTTEDYRGVLTIRQAVDLFFVVLLIVLSPHLAAAYELQGGERWIFLILGIAVLFSSFQIIPTILLERDLAYSRLGALEVLQTFLYTCALVSFSCWGFGAKGFVFAWIVYGVSGSLLSFLARPWPLGWSRDWKRLRKNLTFAIPFQATGLISLIRESLAPLYIGLLLGTAAVGYINWAQMLALFAALGLLVLQRVYLSAFSRARGEKSTAVLSSLVEQLLFLANAIVAPFAVVTLSLSTPITILVFGEKWILALPLFYLLWLGNLFLPMVSVTTALLNAQGESRWVFFFTLFSACAFWLIGSLLVVSFGVLGYPLAAILIHLLSLGVVLRAKREFPFRIFFPMLPPWILAGVIGAGLFLLTLMFPITGIFSLVISAGAALALYLIGIFVFMRTYCPSYLPMA